MILQESKNLSSLCGGNKPEIQDILSQLKVEFVNLNSFVSFSYESFIDVEQANKSIHCLIGSCGFLGLINLTENLKSVKFKDMDYLENYISYTNLIRLAFETIDNILNDVEQNT
ncbi:hypothetical protein V4T45_003165 [Vibrio vulnificus]|nr:hypothetical protein [Vibrio vulnificus]ELR8771805.1 hypothetical protein [Vibrio vulnificus]